MAALFLYSRLEKEGMSFKKYMIYSLFGTIFLLIGSRLMFVVGSIPTMEKMSVDAFLHSLTHGGIVFYGGMLGFLAGLYLMSKKTGDNPGEVLDFYAPAIPLFHGFARIGCFLSGCCYGIPFPFGFSMASSPEVIRFPVQLLESLCDFIIAAWLIKRSKHERRGNLWRYLLTYALCRFFLEYLRGDGIRGVWIGVMSTAQIVSVFIIIFVVYKIKQRKETAKGGYANENM